MSACDKQEPKSSENVSLKNIPEQTFYVNDGYLSDGTIYNNCVLSFCSDSVIIDTLGNVSGTGKIFKLHVGVYLSLKDSLIIMSNIEKTLTNSQNGKVYEQNWCEVFDVTNGAVNFDISDYDVKIVRQNDNGIYSVSLSTTKYGTKFSDEKTITYIYNGYINIKDIRTENDMFTMESQTIKNYVIGTTGEASVNLVQGHLRTDTLSCNKYRFIVSDYYDKSHDYAFLVNCYGDSLIGEFSVSNIVDNWTIERSNGYDTFNPTNVGMFGIYHRSTYEFVQDFHFITAGHLEISYDTDSTLVMNGKLITYFNSTVEISGVKVINHN